jgi:hypothetical protein
MTVQHIDANLGRFGMTEETVTGKWYRNFIDGPKKQLTEAYDGWKDPATRTRMDMDRMADAQKKFVPEYRKLYALMRGNPVVANSDLDAMGFPKRPSGTRTPAPVADQPPGFEIRPMAGHQLRIDYFPIEHKRKSGKPPGQHGVEIKWEFAEGPPKDPDRFLHSDFYTASPFQLVFSNDDIGRKLYVALRWENRRGKKGPWSISIEATVP